MSQTDPHGGDPVERYRDQIGRARSDVRTPALLLDLDRAKRNIAAMAERFASMPAKLRPHIKVHKCVALSRMQVDAGAVGVACATAWEVAVMARGGIADVLLANQVVSPEKIAALIGAAQLGTRVTGTVDDPRHLDALSEAAASAGVTLEYLIEVDVGMGRCGVRDRDAALRLAQYGSGKPGIALRGLQGYEGHCMLEPDTDVRVKAAQEANEKLIDVADHLGAHGFACTDLSAGGTGTYYITGANPRITEVQAGSYALMDAFHGNLVPGGFEVALSVAGTVISRQGNTVILDCGRKSVGIDLVTPPLLGDSEGVVRSYAEEHALIDYPGTPPVDLGDVVEVMPGYGPSTVNLHDAFLVVEDGVVTDVWPVHPRGPGRAWLG